MRARRCARSAAAVRAGGPTVGNLTWFIKPALLAWIPPSSLEPLPPFLAPSAIPLGRDSCLRSRRALGAGSRCNRGKCFPRLSGPPSLAPARLVNRASTLPLIIHPFARPLDLRFGPQAMLQGFPRTLMAGIARDTPRLVGVLAGGFKF